MFGDQISESLGYLEQRESALAKVVEENNQLELQDLLLNFRLQQRDAPMALHNTLVAFEENLYTQTNSQANARYLENAIQENRRRIEELHFELTRLSTEVNEKRHRLQQIISEAASYAPKLPTRRNLDHHCTSDVEAAARRFAEQIKSVDETELVQYLARGPRTESREITLEKLRRLAELRFDRVFHEKLCSALQELITRVDQLRYNVRGETAATQSQELIGELERFARDLENDDEQRTSVGLERLGWKEGGETQDLWPNVEMTLAEVQKMRDLLKKNIAEKRIDEQLPAELTSCEREKVAMKQCLATLVESNERVSQYIQQLRQMGVVDLKVCSIDEVRKVAARHEELRRALLEENV